MAVSIELPRAMNYLFGDSSESQLTSNFLDFLREAVDFSVVLILADERIRKGKERARRLTEEANLEVERLERFVHIVSTTIEGAEKGSAESPTIRCATRVLNFVAEAHRGVLSESQQELTDELARIQRDEAAARDECFKALSTLLVTYDPADASGVTKITLGTSNKYSAIHTGHAEFGLDWTIEMAIPSDDLWATPVSVGRVVAQLEIQAPQLTGWISKEVKNKPQKLDRHLVTELVDDGRLLRLKLRPELGAVTGFDIEMDLGSKVVRAVRLGPADDAAAGAFAVAEADAMALLELGAKLRAATASLARRTLLTASTGGSDFREQPLFTELVVRMVAMMAPIVHELSARSRTPNELILRRPLGDDRREEVFLSKAVLRDKWNALDPPLRTLFAPLGLDPSIGPSIGVHPMVPSRAPGPPDLPARPAALPPPTPPPSKVSKRPSSNAPPLPSKRSAPPSPGGGKSVPPPFPSLGNLPPARLPPPRSVPPAASSGSGPPPSPAPIFDFTSVADAPFAPMPSDPPGAIPSTSLSDLPPPVGDSGTRSPGEGKRLEELVAPLRRFLTLAKSGQFDEGYRECAALFAAHTFSSHRLEEQRQALRLMIMPKFPPPLSQAVREAHRVALRHLETLTQDHGDPRDYELLGVTHLVLGDAEDARKAFTTAIDIERDRNPESALVSTLMKRVSAI